MESKRNILVDGFNLGLLKGSGIKTYGVTLLQAYQQMGYDVGVMTDNKYVDGKLKILDEVQYFDQQFQRRGSFFDRKYIRHALDLSRAWRRPKGHEIIPKITSPDPQNYLSQVAGRDYQYLVNVKDVFHAANRLFGATRKLTTVKLPKKPDIWHMTTPLPLKVPGVKTVITVHDLIPLKAPFTTLDIKTHFYHLFKWAISYADLVLSVSEHTKRDIIDIYDVPEEKVQVTYQTYRRPEYVEDTSFDPVYLKSKKLKSEKYILFVGNIEPKKNIKALITAMGFIDEEYKLAIVGRKAWLADDQLVDIDKYLATKVGDKLKKRYVFLDYVSESELAVLYRNATCLVFPSLYEGFGLPVLEAMQNDCPVICSRLTSLPEVAGDAALFVDPYRHAEIRDQILSIINNPERRQSLIEKGRQRVDFFSPDNYVTRLNNAYASLAD